MIESHEISVSKQVLDQIGDFPCFKFAKKIQTFDLTVLYDGLSIFEFVPANQFDFEKHIVRKVRN